MVKNIDSAPFFTNFDNKRLGYNVSNRELFAGSDEAEATNDWVDIVSNGFKFRNSNNNINSSESFVYLAFAESPFKYANAR